MSRGCFYMPHVHAAVDVKERQHFLLVYNGIKGNIGHCGKNLGFMKTCSTGVCARDSHTDIGKADRNWTQGNTSAKHSNSTEQKTAGTMVTSDLVTAHHGFLVQGRGPAPLALCPMGTSWKTKDTGILTIEQVAVARQCSRAPPVCQCA